MKRLEGKNIALFGSTGGIGKELCRYILEFDGNLILVNRSEEKTIQLEQELKEAFPKAQIEWIIADLEEMESVKKACDELQRLGADILIHNAGAYSIPRKTCSTGYDNVFQINFVSPYYITNQLMPYLEEKKGRVVVVGSIAHNYSRTDEEDIDFVTRTKASLVYGNAKRYLMFSMLELSKAHTDVKFAITHPGITFTNITNHYPKLIFMLIKHPMKWIFMKPRKAALSILQGLFEETECYEWIGPRFFNVWGKPSKKTLRTCGKEEIEKIEQNARKILARI